MSCTFCTVHVSILRACIGYLVFLFGIRRGKDHVHQISFVWSNPVFSVFDVCLSDSWSSVFFSSSRPERPFFTHCNSGKNSQPAARVMKTSDEVSFGIRGYLEEVIGAYRFSVTRFSLEYFSGVSRKRLSKCLIQLLFPTFLYRSLYSPGIGQDVVKRVKKMVILACTKTFFYKLHSGSLPVKAWSVEKGIPVARSENCLLGKKPETIEHMFLYCLDAVFFYTFFKEL